MTIEVKPLAEITEEGIHALCKALGAANAMRFVNQFSRGAGDYTSERDNLFKDLSIDEIVSEIKENRESHAESR